MNFRNKRVIVISGFALLAVGYGLVAYYSYVMTEAFTAIGRRILNKPPIRAVHSWDEWFLMTISVMAAFAAIGTTFKKTWSLAISILVLGVSGVWSLMMVVTPDTWRDALFSITLDRWAAAIATLLSFGGLAWICSPKATNHVLQSERVA